MKKNNIEFKVAVETFSIEKVKDILWQLFYSPEDAFKRLHIEPGKFEAQAVAEALIDEYKKNRPVFIFGSSVDPVLSTEGVNLGIKSHIVRDVVLEHCYNAVEKETAECPMEKVIKLLKTPDNGDESSMKRIIGGLKALGFSNKEANYLYESCNLYPVALVLERLVSKKESVLQTSYNIPNSETAPATTVQTPVSQDLIPKIISKKESVMQLFELVHDETEESIRQKHDHLVQEMQRLGALIELFDEFEEDGISVSEILERKEKIEVLFKAMEWLAA